MIESLVRENLQAMHIVSGFEIRKKARAYEEAGHTVIHLELGEPDFVTPPNIVEACVGALRDGHTHYAPPHGIPELRRTIAEYVNRYKKLSVGPENVVVTPGAKPVLFYSILALIRPGDEVIVPSPGFVAYEALTRYCGGVPVPLPLREEKNFCLDPADLPGVLSERTRMVILNSPHNPTGSVLSRQDTEAVADQLRDRETVVFSDEIYDRMIYSGTEPTSIASLPGMADRTIILDGFSKTYAMTGWRLGFGIMPEKLADLLQPLIVCSNSCTATFSQFAGIEALTGPQEAPAGMIREYRRRRDVMIRGLNAIDRIRCVEPDGAFYAFPNIRELGMTSTEAADFFLDEAKVACIPGSSFGPGGEGYVRLSYATSVENIQEALGRIASAVSRLP